MTDSLVIDSSIAVKWYLPEEGSDRAALLLESGSALFAPDLLISEVGNVLWKRRRDMPAEELRVIAGTLTSACPITLRSSGALLEGALSIALAFDRTVYDSLYLALAVSEDCRLVTADERLINALMHTALADYVRLL